MRREEISREARCCGRVEEKIRSDSDTKETRWIEMRRWRPDRWIDK